MVVRGADPSGPFAWRQGWRIGCRIKGGTADGAGWPCRGVIPEAVWQADRISGAAHSRRARKGRDMETEPRFHEVEIDGPIIIWKFSNPPRNLATIETGAELVQLVEHDRARIGRRGYRRNPGVPEPGPGRQPQHNRIL